MDNDLVYVHTYLPGISRFLRCDHLHAPGERVARIVLARRRRGDGSQCFYINIDIAILSLFLIVPKIRFIIIMHVNYSMIYIVLV